MRGRHILVSAALALAFAATPDGGAGAQTLPSTLTAQCVGGSLGCRQVDFFLRMGPTYATTLEFLNLQLTSPGWAFLPDPTMSDATDSNGDDPFLDPRLRNPQHMYATFLFGAQVNAMTPLRMRFEMETAATDPRSLEVRYWGGTSDNPNVVSNVVPEPASVALLGTGLLGMGVGAWRRRRRSTPRA